MKAKTLLFSVACSFVCVLTGITARADELVLGMSAAFSGPTRALGIECYRGASAFFEGVNRAGGIHGRKVVIRAYDDGYNPVPALLNTERLIQDDNVLALFGYVGTPTTTRVLPLLKRLEAQDWRLFFPFTGADVLRDERYGKFVYNLRPSYRQETGEIVDRFVKIGRRRIGVFYQIDVYGRTGWDGVRQALKRHGLSIVAEATYRRGTRFDSANMKEHVELLRAGQADAVICIGAYGACAAFIRDARDAGWDVPIANLSFVGSEQMLDLLQQTGKDYTRNLINAQVVPSYNDTSLPAVREYRAAMEQYQPLPPAECRDSAYVMVPFGFVSFEGFLDAKLMAEILRRAGKNPNREAVRRAADSIQNYSLALGPDVLVSFGTEQHQGLNQIYFTVVRDGRFVPLPENGWKEWQR